MEAVSVAPHLLSYHVPSQGDIGPGQARHLVVVISTTQRTRPHPVREGHASLDLAVPRENVPEPPKNREYLIFTSLSFHTLLPVRGCLFKSLCPDLD